MPKLTLLSIVLMVIVFTGVGTIIFNNRNPRATPKIEIDTAVNQARLLYSSSEEMGEDFSKGPCLSNAIMPGWVVDIVHNPRSPMDDLPENQCPAYIEGKAQHFVELDTEGNLVRTK